VPIPAFAALDGVLGAALTACVGLALAWLLGAIALANGGRDLRREVQRSEILSRINAVVPPSGALLNALARFDPFPEIPGPSTRVPAPAAGIGRDADVARAGGSVVRILGTACGLGVQGSGWVARPGLVVTNAHVVAGQDDTRVELGGEGEGLDAHAVHFDPRNDVAVLRVPGLEAPVLRLAPRAAPGTPAAVLGFPLDGPYDVQPARLGRTQSVQTPDAYGRGRVLRRITALRGVVRSGNSGGPAVDGAGRVVTTVFAAGTSGPPGGYGVPNEIVSSALQNDDGPVSTGPCA
jgi:S1-C subfamily serine protease